ncbi:hypothetical protein TOPH_07074 [Tolypocladium ophioglossoides CBS 100239]|uniref:Uncharacterized protein n=1 Tax=Tolypocladium ophioglossoides (strain CBS 100239) TaxID=1163406 RepID=A0A0L0N2F9_TOLOC|nr:hypothetical protein TOPH_07074 [Tolypocladium ophioglossoides CBS 100239]
MEHDGRDKWPSRTAVVLAAMSAFPILKISIGQASRGGAVVAFNGINRYTKGVGLAVIMNGYVVATYFVPILS